MFKVVAVLLLSVWGALAGIVTVGSGFGNDLSSLNFENIIGGPLIAVVSAQAMAASTSADFIQSIGFTQSDPDDDNSVLKVAMAMFNYNNTINGTLQERSMAIPFLYIVPIPFLQFDSVTLDFLVNLNSVAQTKSTFSDSRASNSNWNAAFNGDSGNFQAQGSFQASVTSQYSSATSSKVTRNYSLQVNVQASQASVPAGMERLIDLFEAIILTDAPPIA